MLQNSLAHAPFAEPDSGRNLNEPDTAAVTDTEFYAVIEKDGNGGFTGTAPHFDSCYGRGKTLDELMANMQSAIRRSLKDSRPDDLAEIIGMYKIEVQADPQSKHRGFYVLVEDDREGAFIGIVPELKGCLSYGLTLDELMSNMEEVILLCLEDGADGENPGFFGILKVAI